MNRHTRLSSPERINLYAKTVRLAIRIGSLMTPICTIKQHALIVPIDFIVQDVHNVQNVLNVAYDKRDLWQPKWIWTKFQVPERRLVNFARRWAIFLAVSNTEKKPL